MAKSFDFKGISERFFSLFGDKKLRELSEIFGASTGAISDWRQNKKNIPWDKLAKVVEMYDITWDWLISGEGEPYGEPEPLSPPTPTENSGPVIVSKQTHTWTDGGVKYNVVTEVTKERAPEI